MKKRNYSKWILVCVVFLLSGCKATQNTEMPEASIQKEEQGKRQEVQTETETEVRAVFKEEKTEGIGEKSTEKVEENAGGTEENEHEDGTIVATDETFDYVALGNSVTCSWIEDGLWWGNWGMAASAPEKDYIHLISKWLADGSPRPVTTMILDLKKWEVAQERDAVLRDYEGYFSENTDLVTIQTGENVTYFKETLDLDYLNLIKFIKEKAPNAQILMLGELLWPAADIEAAKQAACETYGVTFVDMAEYLNGYADFYKSAVGTEVLGEDGETHVIVDEAVAAHPNDAGMACIAKQVIEKITVDN